MSSFPNAVQAQPFSLSGGGAIVGATSITLQSFKQIDGTTNLTMSDFGTIGYGTLEPGNGTLEEQISFSGVVQNSNGTATLTGVKTVLFTTPYTETSGLAKTHAGATTFVISNDAGFYNSIKGYVDTAIIAGGVPATTTVPGISILASDTEINAGTATKTYSGTPYPLVVTPNALLTSEYQTQLPTSDQKAALAGTGTPSSSNPYVNTDYLPLGRKSMTAGETIAGATTPVPIYQDSSSGKVLSVDANDTSKLKFIGFAVTSSTDTNPITVQTSGIVSGFTGLSQGVQYYAQDTAGTIGTTPGTYEILVGIAVSSTQLLILKGNRYASGTFSAGTASGSTALTVGFRPSRVRIIGRTASTAFISMLDMTWTPQGTNGVSALYNEATEGVKGADLRLYDTTSSNYMTYAVDTITATGFTITYTESGTFNGGIIYWEAEGNL